MSVKIRLAENQEDVKTALKIRESVFVKGQGIEKCIDADGLDDKSEHVILFYDNVPAGCARIRNAESGSKIERVAILGDYRGRGLGKKLMEFTIDYLRENGVEEAHTDSQYQVKDFYAKIGFKEIGEPFQEAGIKHIKMSRRL